MGQGLKLETEGGILGDKHKKKRQRRGKRSLTSQKQVVQNGEFTEENDSYS